MIGLKLVVSVDVNIYNWVNSKILETPYILNDPVIIRAGQIIVNFPLVWLVVPM